MLWYLCFCNLFQVSRTQLNHIKRLKQSGDGIQTKHVSRVIGGLDKSHVKPYGALLEDEQRRLHEHWSVILTLVCMSFVDHFSYEELFT